MTSPTPNLGVGGVATTQFNLTEESYVRGASLAAPTYEIVDSGANVIDSGSATGTGLGPYTVSYVVDGTEDEGTATITVTATDCAGNTDTRQVTFNIDLSSPGITDLEVTPFYAKDGTLVTASFNTDNDTDMALGYPAVTMNTESVAGDEAIAFACVAGAVKDWDCTLTIVDASHGEGDTVVTVTVQDTLGNSATATDNFVIDTGAPNINDFDMDQEAGTLVVGYACGGSPPNNALQGTVDITLDITDDPDEGATVVSGIDTVTADLTLADSSSDTASDLPDSPPAYFFEYTVDATTPNGETTVLITVTDAAGNESTDELCFYVNKNQLEITVKFEAINTNVSRDVTFNLYQCGVGTADTVEATWTETIGLVSGTGTALLENFPTDAGATDLFYLTATEYRTLVSRSAGFQLLGVGGDGQIGVEPVAFTSTGIQPPDNNSMLLAGDFSGDDFVDVEDFSILAQNFNTLGDDADATGDGLQGSADFTAILANFFVGGYGGTIPGQPSHGCGSGSSLAPVGLTSISASSLSPQAAWAADVTGDGTVDLTDVRAFARIHRIQLTKDAVRTLNKLDRSRLSTRSLSVR